MKFVKKRRAISGVVGTFVFFPMLILSIDAVMSGSNLTGAAPSVCFQSGVNGCSDNGKLITFSCPPITGLTPLACNISNSCQPILPYPAYCFAGAQYINPGVMITVNSGSVQAPNTGLFTFGSIGFDGFTAMITVGIVVAVLAGLNILGSGLNPASVKIMIIGGLILGIWFFLSSIDGFVSASPNSLFTQLNNAAAAESWIPIGTITYILLTLMTTLGTIAYISGGASGE